ncbi:MAG: PRC-barrel domain-containing protein, partial [Candidatus Coproplasma sp.]
MEFSFCKVKKLDVISLSDGKNLGKLCDVTFTMPDGKIKGFTATGCKGFKFGKSEVFIPLSDIVKIGEDAVLVKTDD